MLRCAVLFSKMNTLPFARTVAIVRLVRSTRTSAPAATAQSLPLVEVRSCTRRVGRAGLASCFRIAVTREGHRPPESAVGEWSYLTWRIHVKIHWTRMFPSTAEKLPRLERGDLAAAAAAASALGRTELQELSSFGTVSVLQCATIVRSN
jgi:hypothetical protein